MSIVFPFVIRGKVGVIFSQISSSGDRRKEEKSSATRGTYLWMNLLQTPLVEQQIREVTEIEHLTRMNSIAIITDTSQMIYLMKGALNKMNSSHTTRRN